MFLNHAQIEELKSTFTRAGLVISDFSYDNNDNEFNFYHILDKTVRFIIRTSIQGASIGDVYCEPYTYMEHIYRGCNNFSECLSLAREWAVATKYKLANKTYYHKVFISHSSEDKTLINEFIDKILRLSCGLQSSEIIYTSCQSTGVEPGYSIPRFIKDNLISSSLVLFMISPHYKQSEICLNEMGAAWALDKKTISILLPNVTFDSLGWLTSFDKAIKINDSEGLDKIAMMLSRNEMDISDWNRQKESFLSLCETYRVTEKI